MAGSSASRADDSALLVEILKEIQALRRPEAEAEAKEPAKSRSLAGLTFNQLEKIQTERLAKSSKSSKVAPSPDALLVPAPVLPAPSLDMTRRPSGLPELTRLSRKQILTQKECQIFQGVAAGFLLNFRRTAAIVLVFLIACQLALTMLQAARGSVKEEHARIGRGTTMASYFYALIALILLRLLRRLLDSKELQLAMGALNTFMDDAEGHMHRRTAARRRSRCMIALWLGFNVASLSQMVAEICPHHEDLSNSPAENYFIFLLFSSMKVASMLLSSGIITQIVYLLSDLLCGLQTALDCWSAKMLVERDFAEGVTSWNLLQAMLKSMGSEVSLVFSALYFSGNVTFLQNITSIVMIIIDLEHPDAVAVAHSRIALGSLLLPCLAAYLLYAGAAVTQQCYLIPAFVNQIPGGVFDEQRDYLVRFIQNSSAGFMVHGVRLTQELLLKQTQLYVLGLSSLMSILIKSLV